MSFESRIAKARRRTSHMDATDREHSWAAPVDNPESIPRTAMAALECALKLRDWRAVEDAYVLLEQLDTALRSKQ